LLLYCRSSVTTVSQSDTCWPRPKSTMTNRRQHHHGLHWRRPPKGGPRRLTATVLVVRHVAGSSL
jgi:hypothetical protein